LKNKELNGGIFVTVLEENEKLNTEIKKIIESLNFDKKKKIF